MPKYQGVERQPDGTFRYRRRVTNPKTGRPVNLSKRGFATASDANNALQDAINAVGQDKPIEPSLLTVEQFFETEFFPHLDHEVIIKLKRKGYVNTLKDAARRWVFPIMGDYMLTAVTRDDGKRWLMELSTTKSARGTTYSTSTLRSAFNAFNLGMNHALDCELIQANPLLRVRRPKKVRSRPRTWTSDQVQIYYASILEHRLFALAVLLFTTGMRRGELMGLRWEHVHLPERMLSVARQRTTAGPDSSEIIDDEITKTTSSDRRIDFDETLAMVLAEHLERQQVERKASGDPSWNINGYVFVKRNGQPYHPDTPLQFLQTTAERAGLPRLTLHQGRHTTATLLLEAEEHIKVVCELLGHSGIGVTGDIYSHITPVMHRDAVTKLSTMIPGVTAAAPEPEDELALRRRRHAG